MRILFVGLKKGQPRRMSMAMERLGYDVTVVNPYEVIHQNRYLTSWAWHTGAFALDKLVYGVIKRHTDDLAPFDVAFVDSGDIISETSVRYLRTKATRVVLFCRDNPFVPRDGLRWRALLKALPHYDLFANPRQTTVEQAPRYGARAVLRVNFFADELLHRPRPATPEERLRFGSPVSFVGTWFPERGPFMQTLIERGVPLRIIGAQWHKAKNYRLLKPYLVEGYLSPEEYAGAVLSAQISIAMLSKGNVDVCTSRSMEIPSLGGLLCAERTPEHLGLYKEGVEAAFWSSAEECAELCSALLENPTALESMRHRGHMRAMQNNNWTEPTMKAILAAAMDTKPHRG